MRVPLTVSSLTRINILERMYIHSANLFGAKEPCERSDDNGECKHSISHDMEVLRSAASCFPVNRFLTRCLVYPSLSLITPNLK